MGQTRSWMAAAGIFLLALAGTGRASEPAVLKVVTEDYPPFQYKLDGKVTGPSAELVETALERAGFSADIEILPWARAMRLAEEKPDVLIFSLGRTADRERRFKWIGQINENSAVIYARAKSGIEIQSFDDLKHYKVGAVIDDIREKYLLDHGFIVGGNLEELRQHALGYAMLKTGRIDLWSASPVLMRYLVRQAGDDPDTAVRPVWEIKDIAQGYSGGFLACGLGTSDDIAGKLKQAFDQMKADGTYAAIHKKWESDATPNR